MVISIICVPQAICKFDVTPWLDCVTFLVLPVCRGLPCTLEITLIVGAEEEANVEKK